MQKIKFVPELINEYSYIPALFLANVNPKQFEISSDVKKTDILGLTVFDSQSLVYLRKARKKYPNNKIIVGGIGVTDLYHYILEYADYVYFGQAFEFDDNCVLEKKGTKKIKYNNAIPWEKIPIVRTGKKSWYFMIESGCPFKCEYCNVSHISKFDSMPGEVFFDKVFRFDIKYKGQFVRLLSNEGYFIYRHFEKYNKLKHNRYLSSSIPLKSFVKYYKKGVNQTKEPVLRFGIELPTEELRKKILPPVKHISDDEILDVIYRMNLMGQDITLFLLYNYPGTTPEDFERIYELLTYAEIKKRKIRVSMSTFTMLSTFRKSYSASEYVDHLLDFPNFDTTETHRNLRRVHGLKVLAPAHMKRALHFHSHMFLPGGTKLPSISNPKITARSYLDKLQKYNPDLNIYKTMDSMFKGRVLKNGYYHLTWGE